MAWLACGVLAYELRPSDQEVVVGNGPDATWRVTTADLMPRHFAILVDDEGAIVRPFTLESVISVGGVQVPTKGRTLGDGDVIAAGSGRFSFSHDAPRADAAPAEETAEAYLVEAKAGVAHPLNSRSTPIGRDASNAIVIRNPTASRFHAEIRREAGGFALHSMGSAGTVKNGRLMKEPALLREGDHVEIAFTTFEFTRKPLDTKVTVAARHSGENDESTRKPTLATEWVTDEDGEGGESAPAAAAVLGLLVMILSFLSYVWLKLR